MREWKIGERCSISLGSEHRSNGTIVHQFVLPEGDLQHVIELKTAMDDVYEVRSGSPLSMGDPVPEQEQRICFSIKFSGYVKNVEGFLYAVNQEEAEKMVLSGEFNSSDVWLSDAPNFTNIKIIEITS